MTNDILLAETGDLKIVNGDFEIGESLDQEVQLILEMAQGELKEDPLLGADIFRLMHTNATEAQLKQQVKVQLARDGKDYDKLKQRIGIQINE
jgi:hypothetical protein